MAALGELCESLHGPNPLTRHDRPLIKDDLPVHVVISTASAVCQHRRIMRSPALSGPGLIALLIEQVNGRPGILLPFLFQTLISPFWVSVLASIKH